ncbi:MAG: 2-C-methyl-D-erythritol 2,4-cyclodiphosphate synthase [Deltaproteobacteria bacterium]|nr:2-C-methyl-D-erythritol 2,4-cyclodiphosphate synthase [Deltaproteobacteria bacterium]
MRVGLGYDVHRFAVGRALWLGGVEIPHDRGLEGHSDADVLLHAVMDALLGAAGLRDIGHYFPNTDPQWEGASSLLLLRQVRDLVAQQGFQIGNVDVTVLAEAPKIGPHVDAIRAKMADALGVVGTAIGIKATTHEGLGAVGRREGIAAMAVALLRVTSDS